MSDSHKNFFRLMSYNIHSCIGTDRHISHRRIAKVIARYSPDFVALQEVDFMKKRSDKIDQAKLIAEDLNMEYFYQPSLEKDGERYGIAFLTHFPFEKIKAEILPGLQHKRKIEPRSAIWMKVDLQRKQLNIISTHLGLRTKERRIQFHALMGDNWLEQIENEPVTICGDFNTMPWCRLYKKFNKQYPDVQKKTPGKLYKTFPSRWPLVRIDHVFTNDKVSVQNVKVPKTTLTKKASDHLPIIVDIKL